jgi:hypothetical protein
MASRGVIFLTPMGSGFHHDDLPLISGYTVVIV